MASDQSFADYVRDQIRGAGDVTTRKMFGEYAVYLDGKVVALICDNQCYVRPTDAGRAFLGTYTEGHPFPGSKPHLLIAEELDDAERVAELVRITAREMPPPKKKAAKNATKNATKKLLVMLLLLGACARDAAKSPAGDSAAAADSTSAAPAAPLSTNRDCGTPTALAEDGIGRVRIGATAGEIRATCEVVRDTTALASEGISARTLLVRVGDDSVLAVVVNDRVQSISVETPAFRTSDGLGVGTPVHTLLAQPGVQTFGGEGNVVLVVPGHCGMSFVLPPRTAGKFPIPTLEALRSLPASTAIARVLVFACIPDQVRQPAG